MLVRIGESEKEPRFVNVRLGIVIIIQSISFDIHQSKCSACVLNLLLEYHWAGWPTHAMKCSPVLYYAISSDVIHGFFTGILSILTSFPCQDVFLLIIQKCIS